MLLRRVKAALDEPLSPPRFVGIDDWAIRKGQNYGTILIDLQRRRVIDILPGRDGVVLKTWLQEHPGVEVITRDRWSAFAQAAKEGAPQAQQVADRWHLLKNLREAVERVEDRFLPQITTIAQQSASADVTPAPAATEEAATGSRPVQPAPEPAAGQTRTGPEGGRPEPVGDVRCLKRAGGAPAV